MSGRVTQISDRYRLIIRALDVQTAQVQGQYNRNIAAGKTINDLMRSGGSAAAGGSVRVTQSTTSRTTGSGSAAQAAPSSSAAGGNASVEETVPEGALLVNSVATWNAAINRIRNGGNDQTYIISVTGTVSVPAIPENENLFGSVIGLTVTIQGGGTFIPTQGSLLRIGAGQMVIARNVTFRGNSYRTVIVNGGGTFRMETGASVIGNSSNYGGGVYVSSGTFTKTGGTISGNDSSQSPGNTASSGKGHALSSDANTNRSRWRNATAGPNDNTDGYGFWMND